MRPKLRPDTRLAIVTAEGEGQRIEFKRAVSDLAPTLVAFANASGGSVFVGIDDRGNPSGLKVTNRLLSEIQDTATNCDPPLKIRLVPHGDSVVEVAVEEGADKPYRCKTGFFVRNGPNTQKLRRNDIRDLIIAAGSFHFDELDCEGFSFPRDFDLHRCCRFLSLAGIEGKTSDDALLLNLDVARRRGRRLVLNNAAALFFAKKPQHFFRESYCTAVRYQGTDRFSVVDRQEIDGDPISIIEQTMSFVQRNIAVSTAVVAATQHRDSYEYPLVAIREAVVNAVAHRDYHYDASHIYVSIFADRLEIENPGGLVSGLSIGDLGQRSVRRNRAIADLLYRAKFIERIGSGIDRMRRALAENNNPPFEVSSSNFFLLRLRPRIASADRLMLSERQLRLYRALVERRTLTKSEAAKWLEVSDDTALRELMALVRNELVRRQGTGRATRYCLA